MTTIRERYETDPPRHRFYVEIDRETRKRLDKIDPPYRSRLARPLFDLLFKILESPARARYLEIAYDREPTVEHLVEIIKEVYPSADS